MMIPQIRFLFIGTPSRASIQNQQLLASDSLPIKGHFEASLEETMDYLDKCTVLNFPEVILIDENMGSKEVKRLLKKYKKRFYAKQIDTLIFISGDASLSKEIAEYKSLITGYIQQPMSKTAFLEQIYPLISVTVI